MKIETINPATGQLLATYTCLTQALIKETLESGHQAYLHWRKVDLKERARLMLQLADLLQQHIDALAGLISTEMGKPITFSKAEINKCAWLCKHYAQHAAEYLAPKIIQTEMKKTKVCYQPMGIVFGIMPWNYPFWQVFRFAVPALMAGNAVILKHAPVTTGSGNQIASLFIEAGFPEALFQHAIVSNEGAAQIIEHDAVTGVTFTGSGATGRIIAAHAGAFLKKTVLELGGSDPYIILADADLENAAKCIVASRLSNSGQVCIAAKRIIVVQSVAEKLTKIIMEKVAQYRFGDPLNPETNMGPLARKDLLEKLHFQVEKSVKQGAKLLLGGIIPQSDGFYYPPTVLTDVKPGMVAFDEELFGPVIALCAVANEKEAIEYANATCYGLSAAVFTRDEARGEAIATNEIDVGTCYVNAMVSSDPRVPFGGIKQSGYGRELSREGILEFVNIKTVGIGDS